MCTFPEVCVFSWNKKELVYLDILFSIRKATQFFSLVLCSIKSIVIHLRSALKKLTNICISFQIISQSINEEGYGGIIVIVMSNIKKKCRLLNDTQSLFLAGFQVIFDVIVNRKELYLNWSVLYNLLTYAVFLTLEA